MIGPKIPENGVSWQQRKRFFGNLFCFHRIKLKTFRNYRILVASVLLNLPIVVALAQEEMAEKVLQEVIAHGQQMQDFEAEFHYEIQTPNRRNLKRNGLIRYMDHKYAIYLDRQEIFIDGSTQWIYDTEANVVHVSPYEVGGTNVMELLFQLFAYKISSQYLGEELVRGVVCDKLLIQVQNQPDLTYHTAYVWVGRRPRMFSKVSFMNQRMNTTNFEFVNIQTNRGFRLPYFQFDKLSILESKFRIIENDSPSQR